VIPAIVEFVDIAGLVAGASKGEGLGNQFLANTANRCGGACGALLRRRQRRACLRKIDPLSDIETIDTELALADLATVDKRSPDIANRHKSGGQGAKLLVPC